MWSKRVCIGRCPALSRVTNDDIKEGMAEQGVMDVRRITVHRDGIKPTNTFVITFTIRRLKSRYKNYQQVYTDGSKEDSKVGCAVISGNHSNMQRISDDSSIFTAEAKAFDLALYFIRTCDTNNRFIIFSDLLSVLKAMNHTSSKLPHLFFRSYVFSPVTRSMYKLPRHQ